MFVRDSSFFKFERTQQIVEEFEKEGGEGQRLQAMLIQVHVGVVSVHVTMRWCNGVF